MAPADCCIGQPPQLLAFHMCCLTGQGATVRQQMWHSVCDSVTIWSCPLPSAAVELGVAATGPVPAASAYHICLEGPGVAAAFRVLPGSRIDCVERSCRVTVHQAPQLQFYEGVRLVVRRDEAQVAYHTAGLLLDQQLIALAEEVRVQAMARVRQQLAAAGAHLQQQPVAAPGLAALLGGSLKEFVAREMSREEWERAEREKQRVLAQTGNLRL